MSGLETNLKSTRPRPGYYETKTETASKRPRPRPMTETLKIDLETFITDTHNEATFKIQNSTLENYKLSLNKLTYYFVFSPFFEKFLIFFA